MFRAENQHVQYTPPKTVSALHVTACYVLKAKPHNALCDKMCHVSHVNLSSALQDISAQSNVHQTEESVGSLTDTVTDISHGSILLFVVFNITIVFPVHTAFLSTPHARLFSSAEGYWYGNYPPTGCRHMTFLTIHLTPQYRLEQVKVPAPLLVPLNPMNIYRRTNIKQVFLQALNITECFGHWMKGQRSTERYKKRERKEKDERQKDKWKGKRKKK